jgi:hypothetical protein
MKDTRIIEQLREALANVDTTAVGDVLGDFDLDLVGFNCLGEIDPAEPWVCPFQPGCGAKDPNDCPETKRRARILAVPRRRQ